MTDAEFKKLQEECRAYVARTEFPPVVDHSNDDYAHHGEHAEYGASQH